MPAELRHRPPVALIGECAGCLFAVPEVMDRNAAGDDEQTPVLTCHRYPPVAIYSGDPDTPVALMWPQINGDDWCGEWAPA